MTGDFEKLAYQEAVRGLDKQETLLEALRTRTGILMASSFLAASFLGQQIVSHSSPPGFVVVALLAFVASMGGGVAILLPKRDLVFAMGGTDCYAGLYELQDDIAEVYRRLAYELDRLWEANNNEIRQLSRIFTLLLERSLWRYFLGQQSWAIASSSNGRRTKTSVKRRAATASTSHPRFQTGRDPRPHFPFTSRTAPQPSAQSQ